MSKIFGKIIKDLEPEEFYKTHLNILNCFLPASQVLSPREIDVLSVFLSFEGEHAEVDRFGTTFRKIAKAKLGGMSDGGLTNHLTTLKNKGVLEENLHQVLSLKSYFYPLNNKEQVYNFKIIKKDGKQD